ncbi:hypothetical protein OU426_17490 [Frigidibacter sp. RF13]|uniref:hypothetical protein n=1 Tax=Frigidibacter sp. RF13 TaxID=2997340 RepID=UPI002271BA63|nr:hypothetical protein [Frigidibacter sp. RF13]MCY1128655.1 hypothetical protein [Frigidibacter sp. RF13]
MSGLITELARVIQVAKSWLNRELTEEETRLVVAWYEREQQMSNEAMGKLNTGLAAASAVIAEGRTAAERAMQSALASVARDEAQTLSGAAQAAASVGATEAPGGPKSLSRLEERTLQMLLENHLPGPGAAPPAQELQSLAHLLAELIRIEVTAAVDMKLLQAEARIEKRLNEVTETAIRICNELSAEIREQLAAALQAEGRRAATKKSA